MKISLYAQVTDLIPTKKTFFEKLNNLFISDEKHKMFKTQSIKHIFKSLKQSGLEGLELIFSHKYSEKIIQEVKEIINENGLQVFSIHQSNDNINRVSISEIRDLCMIASSFKARVIVLHSDTLGNNLFNEKFVLELKKLQDIHGLKFGIENMPKSLFSLSKEYSYNSNEFSKLINKIGLDITLDTTHLGQVNGDLYDFYEKNKNLICNIHLSDYKTNWLNKNLLLSNGTHLALGKGELPVEQFLKLLKKENYDGLVTMEINSDLQGLCEGARIIKNALG